MACLMTTAWIRSYLIHDTIDVTHHNTSHVIESLYGRLCCYRHFFPEGNLDYSIERFATHPDPEDHSLSARVRFPNGSHTEWCGFECGAISFPPDEEIQWLVAPYSSLVLPLTLLSAWLLLIKPRSAKSAKESSRA